MPIFVKVRIQCEHCEAFVETEVEGSHKYIAHDEYGTHEESVSFDESGAKLPEGWHWKPNRFLCPQHILM
jgi:hypothetical protein